MDIANKIKNCLKKYNLLNKKQHFLVGFSGGADSMLLLYHLKILQNDYDYELSALHINHNWRGKESDLEEKNCKEFCEKYGINFYTERLSKDVKHNENSAREARYNIFDKYAKKYKITTILTGHNSTDVVETFIYRLSKGMGVDGALSIPEKREAKFCDIVRPLLNISSKDIRNDCEKLNLKYNFDSSNLDSKYRRNLIRNEILPKLKDINQSFEKSILNFIENLSSDTNIVKEYFEKQYKNVVKRNKILTSKFMEMNIDLQRKIIYRYIKNNGFEPDKDLILKLVKQIKLNQNKPNGKKYSFDKIFFFSSKDVCCFVDKNKKQELNVIFEKKFTSKFKIKEYKGQKTPKSKEKKAIINKNSLEFPLVLRYRKNGDIIQPFSHKSKIKLKDYFIDKKVPEHKRNEIPLLCKDNEVLWAVGVGISEKLRANFDCKKDCVVLKYE